MKKLIIFFVLCFVISFDLLPFNLGNERFAQVEVDSGMTRVEWYKKNLAEEEKRLRDTMIAKLNISDSEWAECQKKAQESVIGTENKIKRLAQNIKGTWIADYNTGALYKLDHSAPQQKLGAKQHLFKIGDTKINKVKRLLKAFGYSGEIVTLYPDAGESLIAYQNLITIRPDLFLYDSADQAFRLRHELSHIQHQDIVFERAIKNCVQKFFRSDFDPTVHKVAEDAFDTTKLKQKDITLNDIDEVHDLLTKTWWNFHEYRADLDSLFAMKNCRVFRKKIKNQPQYNGYPLNYHYRSAYEKEAPVPYIQDFIEGLRNDSKKKENQNNNEKKLVLK